VGGHAPCRRGHNTRRTRLASSLGSNFDDLRDELPTQRHENARLLIRAFPVWRWWQCRGTEASAEPMERDFECTGGSERHG
jgi:hypothetical protein